MVGLPDKYLEAFSIRNSISDASARGSSSAVATGVSVVPIKVCPYHGMQNSTLPSLVLGIIIDVREPRNRPSTTM